MGASSKEWLHRWRGSFRFNNEFHSFFLVSFPYSTSSIFEIFQKKTENHTVFSIQPFIIQPLLIARDITKKPYPLQPQRMPIKPGFMTKDRKRGRKRKTKVEQTASPSAQHRTRITTKCNIQSSVQHTDYIKSTHNRSSLSYFARPQLLRTESNPLATQPSGGDEPMISPCY